MHISRLESDLKLNWYSRLALPLDSLHLYSSRPKHTEESSLPEHHFKTSHAVNSQVSVKNCRSYGTDSTIGSLTQILEASHVRRTRVSRSRGVIEPFYIPITNDIECGKAVSLKYTLSSER